MNDKIKDGKRRSNSDVNIDDLNNLEDELNDLVDGPKEINDRSSMSALQSDLFSKPITLNKAPEEDDDDVDIINDAKVGKTMAQGEKDNKTWDGYGKFNDIPIQPEKPVQEPQLSNEEKLREKFKYLRMLEELEEKGISLTK